HIGRNDEEGYFYYVMELADPLPDSHDDVGNSKEVQNQNSEPDPEQDPETSGFRVDSDFEDRASDLYQPHTLRAELKQGRLPAARVLEIGLALSEALSHLHGH